MGLTQIIPDGARKVVYAVYAFLGVALGATLAGFAAAPGAEVPLALVVATAVYGFLGTAFGFTAAANVGIQFGELDSVAMPQEIHTYYGQRPLPDAEQVNVAGLNAFLAKQAEGAKQSYDGHAGGLPAVDEFGNSTEGR